MDSSISDAEVTVNLDDSEWVPPDNVSDDDSIEIVGEVCQRRTTRSRSVVTAPSTHPAGEHSPSLHHTKKAKKQIFERGRYFVSPRGRESPRGRLPHQHSTGERDQYHWAKEGFQSPAAARAAAASPSAAGASMGSVTHESGGTTTSGGQKRKMAPDGEGSTDGYTPSNKHFKEPTPARKKKKRNSLSRVPKKSKKMTSLRSTYGPPLGGHINSEKLKKIGVTPIGSCMQSPPTKHNHGSSARNPKNLDDSDLFELDLPDVDVPPSVTHRKNSNNLFSPNRNVSLVHNTCIQSTVDLGGKAVENFSISKPVGNISHPVIKSEKSTTDIELISPTTSTPSVALPNKSVKTEARINHRIARLFGEDSVTSHTRTTPTEKQAPVRRFITLSRPAVIASSSNCATPPSGIDRGSPDILSNTRSPLVLQAASQNSLLLDSSVRSVKSEKTDLDLTSSFEFSPARPSIKKRLSMLKKTTKRASLTGPGGKGKSPALAKSKALVAAALRSKSVVKRSTKAIDPDVDVMFEWDAARVISERQGVSESQARQVICLFEQECTLPFIARYRRENTGNMEIEKLREVQNAFEQLKEVKQKVAKVIKEDQKKNTLSPDTRASLLNATSIQEVKTLTASLKASKGKRTFADRARQLGLTEAADALLNDHTSAQSQRWAMDLVMPGQEGRSYLEEVETGLKHIVADVISKDPKMLAYMKAGLKQSSIPFTSSKARKIKSQEKVSTKPKKVIAKRKSIGGKKPATKRCALGSDVSPSVVAKYEKYFDFSMPAWRIMPHVESPGRGGADEPVARETPTPTHLGAAGYRG